MTNLISLWVAAWLAVMNQQPLIGVGAYYGDGLMEQVCERRTLNGWHPVKLACSWPCLVAGIEQDTLGTWVLLSVPGDAQGVRLCQVVDVGAVHDLEALRARGEVIELPYWLAMEAGWTGYTDGVKVWRLSG